MVAAIIDERDLESLRRAAEDLRDGATIVAQTDTNFGVFCSPFSEVACSRLYEMKGRDLSKPLSLFVSAPHDWSRWAFSSSTADVDAFVSQFWPGPLNIVLPKRSTVPDWVTAGKASVAIVHNESMPVNLISVFSGLPLAATSANLSGTMDQGLVDFDLAYEHIGGAADYIVRSEKAPDSTMSSTIISLVDAPVVVRQGDLSLESLQKVAPNLR